MATLPGIIIKIGAETKDAVDGINRVEGALGRSLTAGERMSRMGGVLGGALLGAAAAAGTLAVKLGIDAVQGAIDEERAMATLNKTLDNMGFASAATEVDTYIGRLQRLYGVSDSELRPAFDRLVRSTRDVGEAERALAIAVDAAAGSTANLESIANAMGRAYDGNTASLGKLGLGLDAATLKSGDMKAITAAMAQTFQGQAATGAATLSGRMDRVTEAAGEASEQIGQSLLRAVDRLAGRMAGVDGVTNTIDDAADSLDDFITGVSLVAEQLLGFVDDEERGENALEGWVGWVREGTETMFPFTSSLFDAADALLDGGGAANENADAVARASNVVRVAAARYIGLARSVLAANAAMARNAVADRYTGLAVQDYGQHISYAGGNLQEYMSALDDVNDSLAGAGGGGGGSQASALDKVNPRLQKYIDLTRTHIDALQAQAGRLETARNALDGYTTTLTSGLLGAINLSDAYAAQVTAAAEGTAVSWVDVFVAQIGDTVAFSGALAKLGNALPDTTGAETFIQQLAGLGPKAGLAVVNGLSTEVATGLAEQLDAAVVAVSGNAGLLGQHFYGEGVSAAEQVLIGMAAQVAKDEDKLLAIGRQVGQPIGAQIKAEIAAAIAEALEGTTIAAAGAAAAAAVAQVGAGLTINYVNPTVIDPVNVNRSISTAQARARARTGGGA